MRVIDLEFEDVKFCVGENLSNELNNIRFYQKYLFLNIDKEVLPLCVEKVTDTAFYLKIDNDDFIQSEKKYVEFLEKRNKILEEEIKTYRSQMIENCQYE